MHRDLLALLVDPVAKSPLGLDVVRESDGEILDGRLQGAAGRSYVITNGIPRFVLTEDPGQRQTERGFAFKWQQRRTYDSPAMRAAARDWLLGRYGFKSASAMAEFFG